MIAALTGVLVACGGGGNDDNRSSVSVNSLVDSNAPTGGLQTPAPTPPAPATASATTTISTSSLAYSAGVFEPAEDYAQRCESPRPPTVLDRNGKAYPDMQGSKLHEKFWIRSFSNEWYLWYDELPDIDPSSVEGKLEYFRQLKTSKLHPTGTPKDKSNTHFTDSTEKYIARTRGITVGYGMSLRWVAPNKSNGLDRRGLVVTRYVEKNSPAGRAGLSRSSVIFEVDGVSLANGSLPSALTSPKQGEEHTFLVWKDVSSPMDETVTMAAGQFTRLNVKGTNTIDTSVGKVGYLAFHSHYGPATKEMAKALATFRDENITDLVLDLRYNGGGYLFIAAELASMIAGRQHLGDVFARIKFNDKKAGLDQSSTFTDKDTATARQFNLDASTLPLLGLKRVFVLSGRSTCSASEALINGLRDAGIEVVLVGERTCGKPYGFLSTDNCGTTYFTIMLQITDAMGVVSYYDGFKPLGVRELGVPLPGCHVPSSTKDFDNPLIPLGDPRDARLKAALYYSEHGRCPPVAVAYPAPGREGVEPPLPDVVPPEQDPLLENMIITR